MRSDNTAGYVAGAIVAAMATLLLTSVVLDVKDPWWWLAGLAVFACGMTLAYRAYR